jgi:hypothetical protein
MVRELSYKVPAFGGVTSHTRCFLHTVNLVAKSLIREFDIKKRDADQALAGGEDDELDELSKVEEEEEEEEEDDSSADLLDDNESGWVDEVELLADDERDALERDIRPVKLALVKVS